MRKKILLILGSLVVIAAGVAAVSAYEAHVINVTAHIENALRVHPLEREFGTVFPQEKLIRTFSVSTSDSFSGGGQRRVLNIDYVIKQKPKPRDPADEEWCHNWVENSGILAPIDPGFDLLYAQEYLDKCYPVLCFYLSKEPDNFPPPGNDIGLPSYHDLSAVASGKINKDFDDTDQWILDLDVPCFEGQCAQDWTHPGWELPAELEDSTFGCDIWVEVTDIY